MPMTTAPPKLYTTLNIPRPPDMAEYLSRVRAVSAALARMPGTPDLPDGMGALRYTDANDIELALLAGERAIHALEESVIFSGEMTAGGF